MRAGEITSSPSKSKAYGIALRALDTLLLKNPERTALGIMFGFSLNGTLSLLDPVLQAHHIQIGHPGWWSFVCIGTICVHLPFVFWSVRHRPAISDEIEGLITLIEATNIGELEKRQAYRRVVNKCIDNFSIGSEETGVVQIDQKESLREIIRETLQG